MIYSATHLASGGQLSADLCVIGTGAGGGPVVREAVRAGLRVVAIEAGSFWRPRDFTQIEYDMLPRLYHDKAGRTTADRAIHVHQGKGVGGSTLHNLNLCARIEEPILDEWRARFGLSELPAGRLADLYSEVEQAIGVVRLTDEDVRGSSEILRRGCKVLGYRGGPLQHNRRGCKGSGFCELGCPFDAKQNALKVFVAPAVEGGAVVLSDTWAETIEHTGRTARRVHAVVRDPETGEVISTVTVEARAVCCSASATGTAALLQRSRVPDPKRLVGSRLHLHPGAAVAGIFEEILRSWIGIPQAYECTEFLDLRPGGKHRIWIVPAFAHPAGVSAILASFGAEHDRYLSQYPQMAALSPMIHDHTAGTVSARGRFGVRIEYWPNADDRAQLRRGLQECARLLLAAGARKVVVPLRGPVELTRPEEVDRHLGTLEIRRHELDLTAVHPMATVWMGDDPGNSCVDSAGRYHHLDNVFVADTSLFPTSTGGPPQLTTYALGVHVGRTIARFLS